MIPIVYPSLTLRRSFWLFDLSVAAICAAFAAHVAVGYLFPEQPAIRPREMTAQTPPKIKIRQVPKDRIEKIGKNHIFGAASTKSQKVKPPEPPKPVDRNEIVESTLNLKLNGITWDPAPDRCSAVIENTKLRKTDVFGIGDEVASGVLIDKIWPKRVWLNEHGKKTYLEWQPKEKDKNAQSAKISSAATRPAVAALPRVVNLDRAEMRSRIDDLVALRDSVKIQPFEENGRVTGLQVSNLGDNPMAAEIGIKDGDVVQSINSVRITSMDKAMEQLTRLSNAPMVRVGIMRNGKRTFLTYRIK